MSICSPGVNREGSLKRTRSFLTETFRIRGGVFVRLCTLAAAEYALLCRTSEIPSHGGVTQARTPIARRRRSRRLRTGVRPKIGPTRVVPPESIRSFERSGIFLFVRESLKIVLSTSLPPPPPPVVVFVLLRGCSDFRFATWVFRLWSLERSAGVHRSRSRSHSTKEGEREREIIPGYEKKGRERERSFPDIKKGRFPDTKKKGMAYLNISYFTHSSSSRRRHRRRLVEVRAERLDTRL